MNNRSEAPAQNSLFDQVENSIHSADPWQASSLLQKAIRRGEYDIALQAAYRFHALRGNVIWRRFLIIAVEDIGIASIDAITFAALACDAKWRGGSGKSLAVIASVVRCLTDAPKDRSTDYLICAARKHSAFEPLRCRVGSSSLDERITMAANLQLPLVLRGIAAWYSSGIEVRGEKRIGTGNLLGLLDGFAKAGVPRDVLEITSLACHRTREPMCIMLPVLWMEAFMSTPLFTPYMENKKLPVCEYANGMPLYCFDKHTRIGKQAITHFSSQNAEVSDLFNHYIPDFRIRDAVAMAAFYVDAVPISRQLVWDGCEVLERLGTESDFEPCGAPLHAVSKFIKVVQKNLGHLNDLRRELFMRQVGSKG